MAEKTKLHDMLDNIINDKNEQAQVDFHNYVADKMKEIIHPNSEQEENNNNKQE